MNLRNNIVESAWGHFQFLTKSTIPEKKTVPFTSLGAFKAVHEGLNYNDLTPDFLNNLKYLKANSSVSITLDDILVGQNTISITKKDSDLIEIKAPDAVWKSNVIKVYDKSNGQVKYPSSCALELEVPENGTMQLSGEDVFSLISCKPNVKFFVDVNAVGKSGNSLIRPPELDYISNFSQVVNPKLTKQFMDYTFDNARIDDKLEPGFTFVSSAPLLMLATDLDSYRDFVNHISNNEIDYSSKEYLVVPDHQSWDEGKTFYTNLDNVCMAIDIDNRQDNSSILNKLEMFVNQMAPHNESANAFDPSSINFGKINIDDLSDAKDRVCRHDAALLKFAADFAHSMSIADPDDVEQEFPFQLSIRHGYIDHDDERENHAWTEAYLTDNPDERFLIDTSHLAIIDSVDDSFVKNVIPLNPDFYDSLNVSNEEKKAFKRGALEHISSYKNHKDDTCIYEKEIVEFEKSLGTD